MCSWGHGEVPTTAAPLKMQGTSVTYDCVTTTCTIASGPVRPSLGQCSPTGCRPSWHSTKSGPSPVQASLSMTFERQLAALRTRTPRVGRLKSSRYQVTNTTLLLLPTGAMARSLSSRHCWTDSSGAFLLRRLQVLSILALCSILLLIATDFCHHCGI